MRLWVLEAGDGDDVGFGFGGGVREQPEVEEIEIPEEEDAPNMEALADEVIRQLQNAGPERRVELEEAFAQALGGGPEAREAFARIPPGLGLHAPQAPQQELQREGPLVLRINQVAPPPAPVVPAVPGALQPARRNGHPRRGNPNHRVVDPRPARVQAAAPMGGARRLQPVRAGERRQNARAEALAQGHEAAQQDAAHQAWVQRFVEMALNDEEDQLEWDSDDEEDAAAWEIPVR